MNTHGTSRLSCTIEEPKPKCARCQGDGYYWRVPNGFNPFLAGAIQTAAVSEKVRCWDCYVQDEHGHEKTPPAGA